MVITKHISARGTAASTEEGTLIFRCVRGVEQGCKSKGIAMAMPSFWGWADIQPWLTANLFEDFEIWVCDADFASGTLDDGDRMADTAVRIADAITAGQAPRPVVFFGFSGAGYLAWLVDHVLGGEQRQIVVVDAAPVHRVGYRNVHRAGNIRIKKLAEIADSVTRPANMLLVCRAASHRFTIPGTDRISWLASDGLNVTFDVTALDHMEMNLVDIYYVIKPYVRAFTNGENLPNRVLIEQEVTFGGKVTALLKSGAVPERAAIERLIESPPQAERRVALGGLLYLAILHTNFQTLRNFVKAVNQTIPNFRDFLYAESLLQEIELNFRKRRKHNFQKPKLGSPQAVDVALGSFSANFIMRSLRNAKFYARLLNGPAFTKRRIINAAYSRIRLMLLKNLPGIRLT